MPDAADDGGEALSTFINGQLATERERRTAINTRGAGLITTSSGLSTLIFGAAALVTGAKDFVAPRLTLWALAGTFLAFMAAAFCGLMSTRTISADVVMPAQLEEWRARDDVWQNTKTNVRRLLAKADIRALATLRAGNNRKMWWARLGFAAQLVALVMLAVAVGAILVAAIFPDAHGYKDFLRPP